MLALGRLRSIAAGPLLHGSILGQTRKHATNAWAPATATD
jgi:hypothetical protein